MSIDEAPEPEATKPIKEPQRSEKKPWANQLGQLK